MDQATQNSSILRHLQAGYALTALEALDKFQCFRLAARIHDLRSAGHMIRSSKTSVESGKSIAVYWMPKAP
jgi:Helix-turn-helix domain